MPKLTKPKLDTSNDTAFLKRPVRTFTVSKDYTFVTKDEISYIAGDFQHNNPFV